MIGTASNHRIRFRIYQISQQAIAEKGSGKSCNLNNRIWKGNPLDRAIWEWWRTSASKLVTFASSPDSNARGRYQTPKAKQTSLPSAVFRKNAARCRNIKHKTFNLWCKHQPNRNINKKIAESEARPDELRTCKNDDERANEESTYLLGISPGSSVKWGGPSA